MIAADYMLRRRLLLKDIKHLRDQIVVITTRVAQMQASADRLNQQADRLCRELASLDRKKSQEGQ
ncbi:MAG: hypothetical protein KGZ65_04140 [Sphingomonadales bacterium]|nr:hypothetical protein [Sphingomonadaceae bacterium]MBS3930403.1 hypothetical protein [Sphingomonadales bacterium]